VKTLDILSRQTEVQGNAMFFVSNFTVVFPSWQSKLHSDERRTAGDGKVRLLKVAHVAHASA
jgi:hypothetical protein